MFRRATLLITVIMAVAISACSGEKPEPVSYSIDMSEYAFNPSTIEGKVGQPITLELVNSGLLAHELMIGREVKLVENRPSGYEVDIFAESGVVPVVTGGKVEESEHGHHSGFMVMVEKPGDTATMTFTANKDMIGEWEIGCFEQEGVHYTAGMKGKLVVSP